MKKIFLALLFGLIPENASALYPFPWVIQTEQGYVFNYAATFSKGLSKDSTIAEAFQFKKRFQREKLIVFLSDDKGKDKELKEMITKCKYYGYKSIVVLKIREQSDSTDLKIFNAKLEPIDSIPEEFLTWRNWGRLTIDDYKYSARRYKETAEKRVNGFEFEPLETEPE
jgi:hypothetical protein